MSSFCLKLPIPQINFYWDRIQSKGDKFFLIFCSCCSENICWWNLWKECFLFLIPVIHLFAQNWQIDIRFFGLSAFSGSQRNLLLSYRSCVVSSVKEIIIKWTFVHSAMGDESKSLEDSSIFSLTSKFSTLVV